MKLALRGGTHASLGFRRQPVGGCFVGGLGERAEPDIRSDAEPVCNATAISACLTGRGPDYDALGVRAGAFFGLPKVEVSETYETNVFALPSNIKSDFVTSIAPSVDVNSQWSRNAGPSLREGEHLRIRSL